MTFVFYLDFLHFLHITFFPPLGYKACGILVPQPEIEPVLPAVEEQTPNYWITREVPPTYYFYIQNQKVY